MSLVRSLILFISNVAANHACRAPLALPAWARAARGGRRSNRAPFKPLRRSPVARTWRTMQEQIIT